jgi:hypothetical protein
MTPPRLHVIGIDPGGTTGWARITVPRDCIYGDAESSVESWDMGEFTGIEPKQVVDIARFVRETQSLDYKVGPCLVIEDFDLMATNPTTDSRTLLSPVRVAAMIAFAGWKGELYDARIMLQSRGLAKSTATDERLKAWGFYDEHYGPHARDATRHAITFLRRLRGNPELREQAWNDPTCTDKRSPQHGDDDRSLAGWADVIEKSRQATLPAQ